ncbi:hypothetical protein [uncultured Novosphingobium sp.]|uniref:hypothetical protein n=1 Tax=uncultured Novosphingobium sp. TaxID=292277 RepID=UPI002582EF33|nr:hypothetical protein [uncultured Novosphingobium sp.]
MEEEGTSIDISPRGEVIPSEIKLTDNERSEITDHINLKAVQPDDACVVCGSPANYVVEDTYRLDVLTSAPVLASTFQPLVSTVCMNCGFVRLFNHNIVKNRISEHKASQGEENGGS